MTAKEWMKAPRALRDHAIGKCVSLLEELSPRKRMAAAAAMILVLAGLCLFMLLGGTGAGSRDSFYGHGNRNDKITFENIE